MEENQINTQKYAYLEKRLALVILFSSRGEK